MLCNKNKQQQKKKIIRGKSHGTFEIKKKKVSTNKAYIKKKKKNSLHNFSTLKLSCYPPKAVCTTQCMPRMALYRDLWSLKSNFANTYGQGSLHQTLKRKGRS